MLPVRPDSRQRKESYKAARAAGLSPEYARKLRDCRLTVLKRSYRIEVNKVGKGVTYK